jgi:signal transduction histidine kinase
VCGAGRTLIEIWNGNASISPEQASKLFDPFFRTDESRTASEGKSGLGLTIASKSLDLLGASYSIKNHYGGVLFHIDL